MRIMQNLTDSAMTYGKIFTGTFLHLHVAFRKSGIIRMDKDSECSYCFYNDGLRLEIMKLEATDIEAKEKSKYYLKAILSNSFWAFS